MVCSSMQLADSVLLSQIKHGSVAIRDILDQLRTISALTSVCEHLSFCDQLGCAHCGGRDSFSLQACHFASFSLVYELAKVSFRSKYRPVLRRGIKQNAAYIRCILMTFNPLKSSSCAGCTSITGF